MLLVMQNLNGHYCSPDFTKLTETQVYVICLIIITNTINRVIGEGLMQF